MTGSLPLVKHDNRNEDILNRLIKTAAFIMCLLLAGPAQGIDVTLIDESKIADDGLYFEGTQGVDYHFGKRITPHGDCIDVINGYIFVTWYKGPMNVRNLMLSRRKLGNPSAPWKTIQFSHKHQGYRQDTTIGDSHNTAAIEICAKDSTIHMIFDMHSYSAQEAPDAYFNYLVSYKNKAFVPDAEFNAAIFKPKQLYLKQGLNYENLTYPAVRRLGDGKLMARYRIGGNTSGDMLLAFYDGNAWSNNTMFCKGIVPLPDRHGYYGSEKEYFGRLYAGFAVRWAEAPQYVYNSGWYVIYAEQPYGNSDWYTLDGVNVTMPLVDLDIAKEAAPADEFGTANPSKISSGPEWTVTESGAMHMLIRVDNRNVHYHRAADANTFTGNVGGNIPGNSGAMFSYGDQVLVVDLFNGKPVFKVTPEGKNQWTTIYTEASPRKYRHFNAVAVGDKVYLYLMEQGSGKAQPLHVLVYDLDFGTPINQRLVKKATKKSSLFTVNKTGFSLKVLEEDVYMVSFYSVKGQLKHIHSRALASGLHHFTYGKKMLASGMYLVEIRNSRHAVIEKVAIK